MIKDCTYGLAVLIFSVPFLLRDFQSNIVTRVLASRRVAKVLSEKIMLAFLSIEKVGVIKWLMSDF